jgi:hypothetical protein
MNAFHLKLMDAVRDVFAAVGAMLITLGVAG